jgi:hypothetical protein
MRCLTDTAPRVVNRSEHPNARAMLAASRVWFADGSSITMNVVRK